jgi:hypothetical protein
MTTIEMIREWLIMHGAHGLCHPDTECGCHLEDLMPCESPCSECEAARDEGPHDECERWMVPLDSPREP